VKRETKTPGESPKRRKGPEPRFKMKIEASAKCLRRGKSRRKTEKRGHKGGIGKGGPQGGDAKKAHGQWRYCSFKK